MNGISTDALVGLAGVVLGGVVSLIVMLVANWLQAWREARRIADQRRYEWLKERLDKIDPYISQLQVTSYDLCDAARGVLDWTLIWWRTPRAERPQITGVVGGYVEALTEAVRTADGLRREPPDVVFGSLKPDIVDEVRALIKSFNRLYTACSGLLIERGEACRQASNHGDLNALEAWKEKWYDEVANECAMFRSTYMGLDDAMRRVLGFKTKYRPSSLLERLRGILFSREHWKYWLGLAVVIILALVGWAIARGIIWAPSGGWIHWFRRW